jgi:hypothetical protein
MKILAWFLFFFKKKKKKGISKEALKQLLQIKERDKKEQSSI